MRTMLQRFLQRPMIVVLLVTMVMSATTPAQELVTEDGPPLNMMEGGKIVGVATEKVQEAFRRLGKHPNVQLVPWSRAYQLTISNANYCAYSTARTPERESLFKWVGPLAFDRWILYSRAGNTTKVSAIEALQGEVIGTQAKGVIEAWLLLRGFKVDSAPYDRLNPAKLLQGRFNYWVSTQSHSQLLLAQQALTQKIVPVLVVGSSDMYLACNRGIDDGLVRQLNLTLKAMDSDGTSKAIENKYGWSS